MKSRKSSIWVYVVIGLAILSIIPLTKLRFDFSIDSLFPAKDPDVVFYDQFRYQFNSEIEDEYILIALQNNEGIFDKEFLRNVDSLTRFLGRLPNIQKVYSLTNFNVFYFSNGQIEARPLINLGNPKSFGVDSAYIMQSPEYRDLLVSKDGKSVAIGAFNSPRLSPVEKDAMVESIREKIASLQFDRSHFVSKVLLERIYVKEIEDNLRIYVVVCFLVVVATLLLIFRSLLQIIIPFLIVIIPIGVTLATMSVTGKSLDVISILIPPLLAIISMSAIIHLSMRYIDQLNAGVQKEMAINETIRTVGSATFFTSLTTAVGFFSLAVTNVVPIRTFGVFAGLGVMVSFVITIVLLSAYFSRSHIQERLKYGSVSPRWKGLLSRIFPLLIKYRTFILVSFIFITAASVFFAGKVQVNGRFLDEIPRNNPILQDIKFVEQNFSGTRTFELVLTARKGKNFFDLSLLRALEEVELFLKDSCGVRQLISPLSLLKGANKAFKNDDIRQFELPATQEHVARYYEMITQTQFADEMNRYMLPDGSSVRISGRLSDLSVQEFSFLSARIKRYLNGYNYLFDSRLTGSSLLLDKVSFYLVQNLITGLLIAFLTISAVVFYLLRSWRMVLIALVVNLAPLFVVAALMGLLGIYLKPDTAVIFGIAFGIAVDNSIHLINGLRVQASRGIAVYDAVKNTYISTGKAIIITNIVLSAGFLTLLTSSFPGTFYIGLLISLCLFVAMLISLIVLPILLSIFYR